MDIINSCRETIQKQLAKIDQCLETQDDGGILTQSYIDFVNTDKDKNLDKIFEQQAEIKNIIDKDDRIKMLRKTIAEDKKTIEAIRNDCNKIGLDALKDRKSLLEEQTKEIEKYQLQQMRSIALDYKRLQGILARRKEEIIDMKKEIEDMDTNREAYLAEVERKLIRQLQDRQKLSSNNDVIGIEDEEEEL